MKKNNVNGFIVLRKPALNYDKEGRGAFLPIPPKIRDIFYAGIDRMPWFDLDEDYYSKNLPDEFVNLREELYRSACNYCDFTFTLNIETAWKLLEYSNRQNHNNDLIAFSSEKLSNNIHCQAKIIWLGADVYCHGYGSLIRNGIFKKPELFSDFADKLNGNGLFNIDAELIDSFIKKYSECAINNNIENIYGSEDYLERVNIGRVLLPLEQMACSTMGLSLSEPDF